jgi:hypothetical protein
MLLHLVIILLVYWLFNFVKFTLFFKYGELRFYRYGETDQITKKKDIINTVSSAVAGKSNSYVSPLGTLIENETKKLEAPRSLYSSPGYNNNISQ